MAPEHPHGAGASAWRRSIRMAPEYPHGAGVSAWCWSIRMALEYLHGDEIPHSGEVSARWQTVRLPHAWDSP